jgi:hypothetical protein
VRHSGICTEVVFGGCGERKSGLLYSILDHWQHSVHLSAMYWVWQHVQDSGKELRANCVQVSRNPVDLGPACNDPRVTPVTD